jgi:adenylate cyclase
MAALVLLDGESRTRIPLSSERVEIGRQDGLDVVLRDAWISRSHATLERRGALWVVVDHQSRYGVYVNDERVAERALKPGDVVRFGSTVMIFEDASPAAVPGAAPGGTPDKSPPHPAKPGEARVPPIEDRIAKARKEMAEVVKRAAAPNAPQDVVASRMDNLSRQLSEIESSFGQLQRAHRTTAALLEFTRIVNYVFDLTVLFELAIDAALNGMRARQGAMLLYDAKAARLDARAVRGVKVQGPMLELCRRVHAEGLALVAAPAPGASADAPWLFAPSAQASRVPDAIAACAPLRGKRETSGVLLAVGPSAGTFFGRDDLELLSALANQAASAVENAELANQVREESQHRANLSRYLPDAVVERILREGDPLLGGEAREVTTLFCDVHAFTSMSETMAPAEVLALLNRFYTTMDDAVFAEEGTVDKYIGDCLMALFGAPVAHGDDPARAVRAALRMRAAAPSLGVTIGIGINTGPVIAGNVGTERRMDYTVIGDAVNVAARLQASAGEDQILIGETTFRRLEDTFKVRQLVFKVKGKLAPVTAYEVIG